ncbi:MAG: HD domain-containing protein [Thermodesulfobacteriota bacterium]
MPHIFISDLKPGDKINQFFLVKKKERRRTRNGKDYLDLSLTDRSGSLPGKIWSENVDRFDSLFSEGQFAGVAGRVETFQDEFQIGIERIQGIEHWPAEKLEAAGFDPDLLIPASHLDLSALWKELLHWAREEIRHPGLSHLTLALLEGHEEAWKKWPASKMYHHAYQGGLLEHTCQVTRLARETAKIFPELNRDLVLAGAVLHDIGKLQELEGPLSAHNTFPGELIGHLIQGWAMVHEAGQGMEWEDPLVLIQLEHILLAHHGQLEFGSPVVPQTREALVVHMLDDLEGKLKMMSDQIAQDRKEGAFTDWHRVLKRKILKDHFSRESGQKGAEKIPDSD